MPLGTGEFPALRPVAEVLRTVQTKCPGLTYAFRTALFGELRHLLDEGALDFTPMLHPVDIAKHDALRARFTQQCAILWRMRLPSTARLQLTPLTPHDLFRITAPEWRSTTVRE